MPGIPSKPNNIPLASSLPKVSFRKVPPDEALIFHIPPGIIDAHAVPFGFNDGAEFDKPHHYIRYVEPIEGDLKKQVEYDMDEQDQEWLDALNHERRKDGLDTISYEVFEIILDQLEKEWFDLMKRVPPKARHGAGADSAAHGADAADSDSDDGEDSKCAICDDGECENSNAIVFCDGCNLAVHQDCYGIPYIPEGQWLCRKCTVSPDRAVSCILCPHEGGAFKQTTAGKWAHLLCAMWIPETGVSNPVYMEPIDSVERIPKARWKLQCYLCRYRMGACIQCDNRSCFTAFHVTCARKAGLLFRTERTRVSHHLYDDSDNSDDEGAEVLRACCHRHMPVDMRDQFKIDFGRQGALDDDRSETSYRASPLVSRTRELSVESGVGAPLISVSRRSSLVGSHDGGATSSSNAQSTSKSARAYKKSFKAGPPLVPAYIANRVLEYITKIHLRKKATAVQLIARYWSLKREARRGAPLLKRLHLEPWTASSQNKEQTDAQKGKKLHFLRSIRADLERVRMLVEQVRKREKEKLRQAQEIRNSLVEPVLFPFHADLRAAIAKFEAVDKYGFFAQPVSKMDVPDYYDIVKEPMDWATIKDKITNKTYDSVEDMRQDVLKIAANAMTYNKADTPYHKAASKILRMIPDVFKELAAIETAHLALHQNRSASQNQANEGESKDSVTSIDVNGREQLLELGLEPPADLVSLLRDYQSMAEEEQMEIRQQAYGKASIPSTVRVKAEEDSHAGQEAGPSANPRKRHVTPVVNLMEDFVHQIYVPPPPPASTAPLSPTSTSRRRSSTKTSATGASAEKTTTRTARKRKASDTQPKEPVERRSTRRSIAMDAAAEAETQQAAAAAAAEASIATPARNKRQRAQSSVQASADTQSAATAKSQSPTTSVALQDGVQVKGDVGAHDSFLLFNTGWVLPEGSKRHRNAAARPEMIGQRPRKISAPESPNPSGSGGAAAAEHASSSTPQQRPRSRTVPSSNARFASSASTSRNRNQSSARKEAPVRSQKEESGEANTAASSPLTTDDEGEEDDTPKISSRLKRTRERGTSDLSEGLAEAAVAESSTAARRRSTRARTSSADASASPSASKRPRSTSKTPSTTHEATDYLAHPPAAGTKVWAKMETFPHFPGMVVRDQAEFPEELRQTQPEDDSMVAVRFFGKQKSWGWIMPNKLAPLLVEQAEDDKFLKLAAKKGKTKQVRDAYEEAKNSCFVVTQLRSGG
ncbi:related to Peregrin (Bromodomain and PHD finger-containing protein 1) [Sporisorium reilianum SRZ2]|uniref:Related to Peregrin (Bromodomain and PHD finger-containing protein 1) n=1 Tax=Sporisorium reilianum (strain SRZ2) TaxID=999809 RepID=E6ZVZ9_SPORE|nr:related to Peregrin (Bromodomain and PHD finger-containing protein 1) [Sporisorium reilianum SRZ2]